MDLKNDSDLMRFIELVIDSRDSGLRIFNQWTKKDPRLLKESDPNFYLLLRSLTEKDIEIINGIVPTILKTSFYSLFEALELGKDGLEFELTLKVIESGFSRSVINSEEDLEVRTEIDLC